MRHPARAHATATTLTSTPAALELGHVLIAVADLAAAGRELEARHGLVSIEGGRHAGYGTANRIVPLGDSYLELVAVADESEAARSPFGGSRVCSRLPRPTRGSRARPRGAPPGRRLHDGDPPVISVTFAHVGGIPIEETLGSFGPALLVGFGVAWAQLRARLRPVRSRSSAHAPRARRWRAVQTDRSE